MSAQGKIDDILAKVCISGILTVRDRLKGILTAVWWLKRLRNTISAQ